MNISVQVHFLSNMQQADNMTYDDMKEVTEGFVCRACEPQCTPNRPGVFTPINLSMSELHVTDNERVHWIDYITEHTEAYLDSPKLFGLLAVFKCCPSCRDSAIPHLLEEVVDF